MPARSLAGCVLLLATATALLPGPATRSRSGLDTVRRTRRPLLVAGGPGGLGSASELTPPPQVESPASPPPSAGPDALLSTARHSSTFPAWLLVVIIFGQMLSNALIAQAVPTAMYVAFDNNRVRTAAALGRISSCAALMDIMLTPQLGRLSDTIGRKPLLMAAPVLALACRAGAAMHPSVGVLVACKLFSLTLTSTFSVAIRAALADCHRGDPPTLTGRLGLVSASAGAAYSVGMILGGKLVSRNIRLPYVASAVLLALLVPLIGFGFRETHPRSARSPFGLRPPAFGFLRLFRSGADLRALSAVSALHTVSMAMGDTWQVFARELRGWDAETCGLFGSLSGVGHTFTALLARRSVRRLGARGHTFFSTLGCAFTDLALGLGSTGVAFGMLPLNWVGRTQGMAVTARITEVGAAAGLGQGALAGDHQNLRSLLKVVGPTLYGSLFGLGCQMGAPALPFVFAFGVSLAAAALVAVTPASAWESNKTGVDRAARTVERRSERQQRRQAARPPAAPAS